MECGMLERFVLESSADQLPTCILSSTRAKRHPAHEPATNFSGCRLSPWRSVQPGTLRMALRQADTGVHIAAGDAVHSQISRPGLCASPFVRRCRLLADSNCSWPPTAGVESLCHPAPLEPGQVPAPTATQGERCMMLPFSKKVVRPPQLFRCSVWRSPPGCKRSGLRLRPRRSTRPCTFHFAEKRPAFALATPPARP
jgi:hypothetical protein